MVDVLISVPTSPHTVYLPYVYGILKTHADRDERLREEINWQRPIYRHDHPDDLLEGYDLSSVDVLGLSCYTWNWFAQCEIGRRAKEANPDCWVIAGGPHCDYDDPDFFRENPYIDAVVKQDGAVPFQQLLTQRVEGRRDWESVPGLYLPGEDERPELTTEPSLQSEEELLDVSPYAQQAEDFRSIVEELQERGEVAHALWETNRGCPYHCSFCDWGSLTFTKVRKFSMERVRRDIGWLARNEVHGIFNTDANLGIFERDVEIVEHLCELKQEHGYPKLMHYSPTKSKVDFLTPIIKNLYDHDLTMRSILSLQHTHPEVLKAVERKNLPEDDLEELIRYHREHGIPTYIQMILGCPNDTYERWQTCLTDLMEWGLHTDFYINNFDILPNAPANDPEYREQWDIETTETHYNIFVESREDEDDPAVAKKHLITSTSSFDEDDWKRMWTFSYFVKALHSERVLTQEVALYFRHAEGIPFKDFYSSLVDELCSTPGTLWSRLHRRAMAAKEDFLNDPYVRLDKTEVNELSDYHQRLYWPEWLFMKLTLNRDRAFKELETFLLDHFSVEESRLVDLLNFHKQVLVHPAYDPELGKTWTGEYDWVAYFDRPEDQLDVPPERGRFKFTVDQRALAHGESIEWHKHRGDDRIAVWLGQAVHEVWQRDGFVTLHDVSSEPLSPSIPPRLGTVVRGLFGGLLGRSEPEPSVSGGADVERTA